MEEYITKKVEIYEQRSADSVDPKLEAIIERLFASCLQEKEYREALGIGEYFNLYIPHFEVNHVHQRWSHEEKINW